MKNKAKTFFEVLFRLKGDIFITAGKASAATCGSKCHTTITA
jgi:hypothetical protein